MIAIPISLRSSGFKALALTSLLVLLIACGDSDDTSPTPDIDASPTGIPMITIVTPTPGDFIPPTQEEPGAVTDEDSEPDGEQEQAPEEQTEEFDGTYVVQSGDTLYGIATRFDITMQSLREANGLGESGAIQAGQVLVIPQ